MTIIDYFKKYGISVQERYLSYIPRPNRVDPAGIKHKLNGVVAHTEGVPNIIQGNADRDLFNWFNNPNNGAATHGYITFSGKLILYVGIEHGIWGTALPGVDCASYQLETQDNGRWNDPTTYTEAQYRTWASVMCALYDFTREHTSWCQPINLVRGETGLFIHRDFNPNRSCPGRLDPERILREARDIHAKINKPVDKLYRVFLGNVQQGAFADINNAFDKWSENMAQIVTYQNNNITSQFINMAQPLKQQIDQLNAELENLKKEQERNNEKIKELQEEIETKKQIIEKSNEQLNKEIAENEKLTEENKKLIEKIAKLENPPKKPFNLFIFIFKILFRKRK
jgi:hypothetical protein